MYVEYMEEISETVFVLTPPGNNPETFRLYEVQLFIADDDDTKDDDVMMMMMMIMKVIQVMILQMMMTVITMMTIIMIIMILAKEMMIMITFKMLIQALELGAIPIMIFWNDDNTNYMNGPI